MVVQNAVRLRRCLSKRGVIQLENDCRLSSKELDVNASSSTVSTTASTATTNSTWASIGCSFEDRVGRVARGECVQVYISSFAIFLKYLYM